MGSLVKKLNIKIIFQMMGFLLIFNGSFMLISAAISLFYKDGATKGILFAGIVTILVGLLTGAPNLKVKTNSEADNI